MEVEHSYAGALSRRQRRELFQEVFESERLLRHSTAVGEWREDPYEERTWPTPPQISETFQSGPIRTAEREEAFTERYAIGESVTNDKGASRSSFYVLDVKDPVLARLFPTVLFDGGGVLLKNKKLWSEGYGEAATTEIKVAYFLRELVHGYSAVLSIHFMIILDWMLLECGVINRLSQSVYAPCQISVCEAIGEDLDDYIHHTPPSIDELRVILFQLCSALEVAWLTHRFVHSDLRPDNVMLKECASLSPLCGRNLVYRRYNDPDYWYVLPSATRRNRILKIVDYDRSYLCAPESVRADTPLGGLRHDHPLSVGYSTYAGRVRFDVRTLFSHLFLHHTLRKLLWSHWEGTETTESIALVEVFVGQVTESHKRSSDPNAGLTASQVLNLPFFSSLRHRFTSEESRTLDTEKLDRENVVVSFATSFKELNARVVPGRDPQVEPTPGPSQGGLTFGASRHSRSVVYCSVCEEPARYKTKDAYLCGRTCYEFEYAFRRRTIIHNTGKV
jgi:hypothetical protein